MTPKYRRKVLTSSISAILLATIVSILATVVQFDKPVLYVIYFFSVLYTLVGILNLKNLLLAALHTKALKADDQAYESGGAIVVAQDVLESARSEYTTLAKSEILPRTAPYAVLYEPHVLFLKGLRLLLLMLTLLSLNLPSVLSAIGVSEFSGVSMSALSDLIKSKPEITYTLLGLSCMLVFIVELRLYFLLCRRNHRKDIYESGLKTIATMIEVKQLTDDAANEYRDKYGAYKPASKYTKDERIESNMMQTVYAYKYVYMFKGYNPVTDTMFIFKSKMYSQNRTENLSKPVYVYINPDDADDYIIYTTDDKELALF